MRHIFIIAIVMIIVSCSQKAEKSKQNHYDKETMNNSTSVESKFDFYVDSVLTHIDAEELCEFNFDFFLPQLNQKLEVKSLKLDVKTTDDYQTSYEIIINERQFKLYKNDELLNGKFWDSGPRNFFRVINEILSDKNINERFYLLYGGNDLHAVFLNKQQFKLMSEQNGDDRNEIPYLP